MIFITKEKDNKMSNQYKLSEWIASSKKSRNFDSYKVYIIKCFNDNEVFYKVGRTHTKVGKRFSNRVKINMPYTYEIVDIIEGNPFHIYKLENKIQRELKEFKYKPLIGFAGMTECFSNIDYSFYCLFLLL